MQRLEQQNVFLCPAISTCLLKGEGLSLYPYEVSDGSFLNCIFLSFEISIHKVTWVIYFTNYFTYYS